MDEIKDQIESTKNLLDKSVSSEATEVDRKKTEVQSSWKTKCKRVFIGSLAVLLALTINVHGKTRDAHVETPQEIVSLEPIYRSDFSDYQLCLRSNFQKVVEDLTKVPTDENGNISTERLAEIMAKHADRDKKFTNIELLSFTKILGKDVANKIIAKSQYAEMKDVDSYMKENNVSTIDEWCEKTERTFANRDYFTIKNYGLYDFGRTDDDLDRARNNIRNEIEAYESKGLTTDEIYLNLNLASIYSPTLQYLSKLVDPTEDEIIDSMIRKVTFDDVISNNELLSLTGILGIDTTNKLLQKVPQAPAKSVEEYMRSNNIESIEDWEEKSVAAIEKENPFNIVSSGIADFGSEGIFNDLVLEEFGKYKAEKETYNV